jgi:undecaprenyl-diphosphatase
MSIPVMLGASLLKVVKFNNNYIFLDSQIILLMLGMICAFIVSMLVVKFLINFVKKHSFKGFGYYRIILGVIILIKCLIS